MSNETASVHQRNVETIAAHIRSGCKPSQKLGVTFENILVHQGTYTAASYSGRGGVGEVLERMRAFHPTPIEEEGRLLGLSDDAGEPVATLEAGSTLAFHARPHERITEVEQAVRGFRRELLPVLDDFGLMLADLGYHPSARARELELIPKHRYQGMSRYLPQFGRFGTCIMRGSASLHVSIDFTSEADAIRKLRIATSLSPLLALLTDNSPIFEGSLTRHHMVRTLVWSNYDPTRPMTLPGTFDEDFSFERYAEFVMGVEAITVPHEDGTWSYEGERTFDEVYADKVMTEDEIRHALNMVFPDARLKTYLEIRPADALPLNHALAYVTLIKGLFYSERNLETLERDLEGMTEYAIDQAKRILIRDGYQGDLSTLPGYGAHTPREWLVHLFDLAATALADEESVYLQPLLNLAESGTTLAKTYSGFVPKKRKIPRIGILPRYDEDHTSLQINLDYINSILDAGGIPEIIPITDDPVLIQSFVDSYDGFVIPGGHDIDPINYASHRSDYIGQLCPERDILERIMVPLIVDADKPLLGICRGHQVLNVALGGTMHHDIKREMPDTLEHMRQDARDSFVHRVDFVEGSRLSQVIGAKHLMVNSLHHQAIDRVADELEVAAYSEDGLIEAIEAPKKRFVYGVQWHPELLSSHNLVQRRLFRRLVHESMRS